MLGLLFGGEVVATVDLTILQLAGSPSGLTCKLSWADAQHSTFTLLGEVRGWVYASCRVQKWYLCLPKS